MPENFHFIQPLWLLALIPLSLLAWRVYRPGDGDNPWRRIVDARLLPLLMVGREQQVNRTALYLLAAGWVIAALALADPTWERKPQPVYQTTAARVVVLDLSRSMYASDLQPSRLVRARYKIEDVLAQSGEGQTGLVVYAGDAFTVSPLTRDVNTIRALLPAVDPGIMPTQGSRADLGLLKAGELLRQAGALERPGVAHRRRRRGRQGRGERTRRRAPAQRGLPGIGPRRRQRRRRAADQRTRRIGARCRRQYRERAVRCGGAAGGGARRRRRIPLDKRQRPSIAHAARPAFGR